MKYWKLKMEKLMQFKNLIKCHFSYAFNKMIVITLIIILFFNIIYNFSIVMGLDNKLDSDSLYKYYLDSSFSLINFIGNIFIISLFSFSYLKKQDQYCVLLITSKISKNKIFVSKYFTIVIIAFFFCLGELIGFYLPIIFLNKIKYINRRVLYTFFDLFLEMIFYGNISLILILFTDNFYLVLVPIALFLFSYNYVLSLESIEGIIKIMVCFSNDVWRLYQNTGLVILYNFLFYLFSYKKYLRSEI